MQKFNNTLKAMLLIMSALMMTGCFSSTQTKPSVPDSYLIKVVSDWPKASSAGRADIIDASSRRRALFRECVLRQHELVEYLVE